MIPAVGGIRLRDGASRRVAFVGPTGAGKTTTLAKLAAHFALRLRKRVAIVSLDTRGLGSNEQLRRYAEVIGVPMHAAQSGADVERLFQRLLAADPRAGRATVAADPRVGRPAGPVDLVLIDTHGVCANDRRHLARLTAMLNAARPHEIHLVLPACMLPSVQARLAESFAPLGVTRVVLTRLDEAVGLGVLLNTIDKLSCGLSYLTNGESVPNHIEEACAERMAALIFPTDK
jgi:flagellar biosynthesis protein FlhF